MDFSLYIHIPYCKRKCIYCDFYSCSEGLGNISMYCNALVRQTEAFIKKYDIAGWETVYIGGGTPSILTSNCLSILKPILSLGNPKEITIEANPDSLDHEKLELYSSLGINRLSLGIQSFQNENLQSMGRLYDSKILIETLEMLHTYWNGRLNFDLIYGFGSAQTWLEDLKRAFSFKPEHISLYQLSFEKGTELFDRTSGKERNSIEEEQDKEWPILQNALRKEGYQRYEVSNYTAKDPSYHNLRYWNMDFWVGVGAGASSFIPLGQWGSHINAASDKLSYPSLDFTSMEDGFFNLETLTPRDYLLEKLMMGLRCSYGLSMDKLKDRGFNIDFLLEKLKPWIDSKSLVHEKGNLAPVERGMDHHNAILIAIMDHLDEICLGLTE